MKPTYLSFGLLGWLLEGSKKDQKIEQTEVADFYHKLEHAMDALYVGKNLGEFEHYLWEYLLKDSSRTWTEFLFHTHYNVDSQIHWDLLNMWYAETEEKAKKLENVFHNWRDCLFVDGLSKINYRYNLIPNLKHIVEAVSNQQIENVVEEMANKEGYDFIKELYELCYNQRQNILISTYYQCICSWDKKLQKQVNG